MTRGIPLGRYCYFCGADISHRRKDAWHCGQSVHPNAYHRREYREHTLARLKDRPRCMICMRPLDPRRRGATCSRKCAYTRYNWFQRKGRS